SLSAYMAYQPKASDTDANRNLISNIHARGVSTEQAAQRILNLAASMMKTQKSGCELREELPTVTRGDVARWFLPLHRAIRNLQPLINNPKRLPHLLLINTQR